MASDKEHYIVQKLRNAMTDYNQRTPRGIWWRNRERRVYALVNAAMPKLRLAPLPVPESVRNVLETLNSPVSQYEWSNAGLRETFKAAGAEEAKITTGGYGLIIQHLGTTLISVVPKAKSAHADFTDTSLTLWPWATDTKYGYRTYAGIPYTVPNRGSARVIEAMKLAAEAFMNAEGDMERFYKALGAQGQCAMCGATLTDELSKARGIGPECITHLDAGWALMMLAKQRQAAGRKRDS